MQKQRVLNFVSGFSGGGIASVVLNYYSVLNNTFVFDIVVNDITNSSREQIIKANGGHVYEVPPLRYGFVKYIKSLWCVLKKNRGSIIHCHLGEKSLFPLLLSFIFGYKKRVLHVHQAYPPETTFSKIIRIILSSLCRLLATDYVACGEAAAKWFYGEKNGNVVVLRNAIHIGDYRFSEELRKHYRELLGINNELLIANIGRLSYPKNHPFLLLIFKELLNLHPQAKLLLIGDGELEDEIKSRTKELGLEDNVVLYGLCERIEEIVSAIDIIVMPSISEGLPMTAVEALSNGLPLVCSDVITREFEIEGRVIYLSLKQDASYWAHIINSIDYKRVDVSNKLEKLGFSIEKEAENLKRIYLG